jgi:hypothetical protein
MNKKEKEDLRATLDSMCHQLVAIHAHRNTFEELFFKNQRGG